MPLTKTEDIVAAANDWIAWGKQFGWVCYGCDDRDSGSYHRESEMRGHPFIITRAMREDIERVLKAASSPESFIAVPVHRGK